MTVLRTANMWQRMCIIIVVVVVVCCGCCYCNNRDRMLYSDFVDWFVSPRISHISAFHLVTEANSSAHAPTFQNNPNNSYILPYRRCGLNGRSVRNSLLLTTAAFQFFYGT